MITPSQFHIWIASTFILMMSGPTRTVAARDAYGDLLPARAKVRIGTVRWRHGDTVTAAAFAPDGQTVATASRDGTLSLWETESGKERVRFRGHAGAVLAVAFAREGKCLISGGADGTVRFWRIPHPPGADVLLAGEQIRCFRLWREEVQVVAFSADGSTAAAGTADGTLVVWDLNQDKERHRFTQEGQVYCLALSADGKQLAANQAACGIVLRDLVKGQTQQISLGVIASLTFSPDGRRLAAGYQHDRLVLWDTARGSEVRVLAGERTGLPEQTYGVLSVCYSSDGRYVAAGGTDHTIRIWEAETGRQISLAKGHGDNVTAVAFDAPGRRLVSGGADNTIHLWEVATGRRLTPEGEPTLPLVSASLSADGRRLALIQSPDRIALWDTNTGRPQPWPAVRLTQSAPAEGKSWARGTAAAFRPFGQTLAVAGIDGRLRWWDLAAQTVLTAERESPRRLECLVWSGSGRALASCGPDHHIDLWEPYKGELLQHMGLQEEAYLALAFDRQEKRLAAASEADAIRLWDCASGLEKPPILGRFAGALALAFSADGRSLWSIGGDGRVRLWELASNQMRHTFCTGIAELTAAAFTLDGRFLAAGSRDGTVQLWDVVAGKECHVFRGHRGAITRLAFAAQAPLLASSSRDTTAIIWNLKDLLYKENLPTLVVLSQRQLEDLWAKLADDAPVAYEALQTLRRAPQQIVPYLRGRMQPVKIDVDRLITELDSDEFPVRERASQQLARYGRVVEKSLRQALAKDPSPEVRRRIRDLLRQINDAPNKVRATPREIRCIELLESIGTAEARRLLQTLAEGIAEAELTQEAKASLARLNRLSGSSRASPTDPEK